MRLTLFMFLLLLASQGVSQSVDSLMAVLDTARNEQMVKTLNELFRAYLTSDPVRAIGYSREALNLGTEIHDQKGMAAAYNNIGVAYRNQGAFDKALEFYLKSLALYESLGNKEGIASAKNNISNIYSIKADYSAALKYLEESHKILNELDDKRKLVGSLNNLGNLHSNLRQYEQAMSYYRQSYQLSEELGEPYADPQNNMGNVYFKQGNYQVAIENYQKALRLERAQNNRTGMLRTLANIGIAYTKANQPDPGQKYLDDAFALARELGMNAEVPEILKNRSYNFYRQGKLGQAYETLLMYDSAREKVFGEESTRRIAQMEMALELSEKEREYELLKSTAELKSLQLRNSRLFIVMIILGVLLVVGALNYFFTDKIKELLKR